MYDDPSLATVLAGHLALRRISGFSSGLSERTRLLVAQLAAEWSGCRWCIEQGRHDWRRAGLPWILLRHPEQLESSPLLDPSEQAACRFAAAVLQAGSGPLAAQVLLDARRHFTEFEIADIAGCLADHHFPDESNR